MFFCQAVRFENRGCVSLLVEPAELWVRINNIVMLLPVLYRLSCRSMLIPWGLRCTSYTEEEHMILDADWTFCLSTGAIGTKMQAHGRQSTPHGRNATTVMSAGQKTGFPRTWAIVYERCQSHMTMQPCVIEAFLSRKLLMSSPMSFVRFFSAGITKPPVTSSFAT